MSMCHPLFHARSLRTAQHWCRKPYDLLNMGCARHRDRLSTWLDGSVGTCAIHLGARLHGRSGPHSPLFRLQAQHGRSPSSAQHPGTRPNRNSCSKRSRNRSKNCGRMCVNMTMQPMSFCKAVPRHLSGRSAAAESRTWHGAHRQKVRSPYCLHILHEGELKSSFGGGITTSS